MRSSISSCLQTEIAEKVGWSGSHVVVEGLANLRGSQREIIYVQKKIVLWRPIYSNAKQLSARVKLVDPDLRNDDYLAESSKALALFFALALRDQDRVAPGIETVFKTLDPHRIFAVDL